MITLTKENFEAEVIKSDVPVVVDFWASWCGPCRMVAPILEEIDNEYDGKIKIGKINVDEESTLASEYAIVSIPTIFIIKNGKIIRGATGTAGEIGHVIVDLNGRQCGCGAHGCLEAYASRSAIEKRIEGALKKGRHSVIIDYLEVNLGVVTNLYRLV